MIYFAGSSSFQYLSGCGALAWGCAFEGSSAWVQLLLRGAGRASLAGQGVLVFGRRERTPGTGVYLSLCDLEEKPTSPSPCLAMAFSFHRAGRLEHGDADRLGRPMPCVAPRPSDTARRPAPGTLPTAGVAPRLARDAGTQQPRRQEPEV